MIFEKTTPLKQIDCVLHFMASDKWGKDANGIDRSPKPSCSSCSEGSTGIL